MAGNSRQRCRRSRGCNYILKFRAADSVGVPVDFAGNEAAQTLQFALSNGVVSEEFVGQAHRSQRKAYSIANMSALRNRQFTTAAPQIHHERGRAVHAAAGDES